MEYEAGIKLGSQVSLAVCPIDDYTGIPDVSGDMRVSLKDIHRNPVRKYDGYFVFCNIEQERYDILLTSESFFSQAVQVHSNALDPERKTVYISMKPRPSYPFSRGATLLRFSAVDPDDRPAGNAYVRAEVVSGGCARAKLGKNGVKGGSDEMSVVSLSGKICIGDEFSIRGADPDNTEVCKILDMGAGARTLKLSSPVSRDHIRGEALMPVIRTRTDERGEGVIYFRNFSMKRFNIMLEVMHKDKKYVRELAVDEGKTGYLGKIRVEGA